VYVHVLSRERRTGKGNEYIPWNGGEV
jgi:hypothetical protein